MDTTLYADIFYLSKKMNFFSYSSLWRFNRGTSDSNPCGLCASVTIIVIVLAYLIFRIVVMFQKSEVELNILTEIADLPIKSTITTSTADRNIQPFMIALDIYSANSGGVVSNFEVTSFTEVRTNSITSNKIPL